MFLSNNEFITEIKENLKNSLFQHLFKIEFCIPILQLLIENHRNDLKSDIRLVI